MHKLRLTMLPVIALSVALMLPASTLAMPGYSYAVVHDYCGSTNGWTAYYKVRVTASGATSANRLTIDSWEQARDPGHPSWYRVRSWPRASSSFSADGTSHHLTLARHASGGVDLGVRIVYRLRAWHNSNALWSLEVHGTTC